jgi:hypothetical protein
MTSQMFQLDSYRIFKVWRRDSNNSLPHIDIPWSKLEISLWIFKIFVDKSSDFICSNTLKLVLTILQLGVQIEHERITSTINHPMS